MRLPLVRRDGKEVAHDRVIYISRHTLLHQKSWGARLVARLEGG
jgi:hypothetical protein